MRSVAKIPGLFVLLLLSFHCIAQPEQNCPAGIPVCIGTYYQPNAYTGFGTIDELDVNNQDCLSSGEYNSVWYIINVACPGDLLFTLTPNTSYDYDWALWDITGGGCPLIYNYVTNVANAYLPVRCNYSGTWGPTGMVVGYAGISVNAAGPPFNAPLPVLAGQTYALMVSNFSNNSIGYTLDFTASTACIFDTVRPKFVSAGSYCGTISDKIKVTMNKPVLCKSLAPNGSDFYYTPAVPGINIIGASSTNCIVTGSSTPIYDVTFSAVLPAGTYWLHAQVGTDTNSTKDPCSNAQLAGPTGDSVEFIFVNPANPQMIKLDTPACIKARIILDRKIKCSSVDSNGSDFKITGPSNVNVIQAYAFGCTNGVSDVIDIFFDSSISKPGTYTLSVKSGTDGNGVIDTCNGRIMNTISWVVSDGGAIATATPNLLCKLGYINLSASCVLQPPPGGFNYTWNPSDYLNDYSIPNPRGFVFANTVYQVTTKDKDFCYRRDTAGVILSIRHPKLNPLDTELCIGRSVLLQASGGIKYVWYPATGLSCLSCPNPISTMDSTITYHVAISDIYDCSDTLSSTVVIHPLPIVTATPKDTTVIYHRPFQIQAFAPGAVYFFWEPNVGLDESRLPFTLVMPDSDLTYIVTAIDTNNCMNSDSLHFKVVEGPIQIPTAFTPNHDGKNDVFKLANLTTQHVIEFRIYNRWGTEIFSTTDGNQGWDGTYKGVKQDMGDYFYFIKVVIFDGSQKTYTGTVTLIR